MKFRRKLHAMVNVDLVPMIDVVFQLVIFFMVSTTFLVTPGIGLVFPESSTAEPVVMTKLVVTVLSRDDIYLNMEKMGVSELSERLAELKEQESKEGPEIQKTIVLEADQEIPYNLLVEVLDVLRKNGYKGVNLKTREIPGER